MDVESVNGFFKFKNVTMPYSYSLFKNVVKQHFIEHVYFDTSIIDCGAGSGGYSELLRDNYPYFDGLEIYPNYITMFNLVDKYKRLIVGDVLKFDFREYDYAIFGDIIEHLQVEEAQLLLTKLHNVKKKFLVAVPYLFEQAEEYGNKHEIHKQPDLTPEIFLQRYPMMHLLCGDKNYGYYINY